MDRDDFWRDVEDAEHPERASDRAALRRLDRLAYWLDDRFQVPGTNIRVGLDGLVGLIPGVGDFATAALGAYILAESYRLGVPNGTLARMLFNLGIDAVVGSIPVLGDVFDIGWKAHRRNVHLLRRHLDRPVRPVPL